MANIEYYKVYDYNLLIEQLDHINSKEKDFKYLGITRVKISKK